MAARKVTEETVSVNIDAFKQAITDVGVKLCDDVLNGKSRNPEVTLSKIAELYIAIK